MKIKLTAGRIAAFQCEGKDQGFLWCAEVPGLGVRVTPNGARTYIFQAKVNGKTMRTVIGKVSVWSIGQAQAEARRLQVLIDNGKDPRQLKRDEAHQQAVIELNEALEARKLEVKQMTEAVTVRDAWQAYVAERSVAVIKGKLAWSDKYREQHHYLTSPGGEKRGRGRRPHEPDVTRPGILTPLLALRLIDLDEAVIAGWLEREVAVTPTMAALAFSLLRAFMIWCGKTSVYKMAHSEACSAKAVTDKLPAVGVKENDSLRRAQLKPWFEAMQRVGNPVISAYLQCLLLTGARRNELAAVKWEDVDFRWKSITLRDKVEGERTLPLTPFVEQLMSGLPRRNAFVFSAASASGRVVEPRIAHNKALLAAGLPPLSLHGLRRSFSSLSEWSEVPAGVAAQLMGHKPSAVAEKHYIQRELDLLAVWHKKIETDILNQAGIVCTEASAPLRRVG
jgi:integrase